MHISKMKLTKSRKMFPVKNTIPFYFEATQDLLEFVVMTAQGVLFGWLVML